MSLSSPTPHPTGSATGAEPEQPQQLPATPTPPPPELPLRRSRRGRRLAKPGETETLTGAQRLLLLDTWRHQATKLVTRRIGLLRHANQHRRRNLRHRPRCRLNAHCLRVSKLGQNTAPIATALATASGQ